MISTLRLQQQGPKAKHLNREDKFYGTQNNAALDTVRTDNRREEDLSIAEHLFTTDNNRIARIKGYTIDEFTKT